MKARKEFGARNLANTLWSIAKLNHFPGDEFMQQLCKEVKEKVHQGNAQNVANLLWSLGVLQYNPGEDVLKALALTVRDKSRDFSGQNISNTVLAFAKLDYNPDEDVLAALAKETLNKLPSFSPQALSNTVCIIPASKTYIERFYKLKSQHKYNSYLIVVCWFISIVVVVGSE